MRELTTYELRFIQNLRNHCPKVKIEVDQVRTRQQLWRIDGRKKNKLVIRIDSPTISGACWKFRDTYRREAK